MVIPLSKPDISTLEKKYVLEALDSGQLSFGPKLKRFEESFCRRFNVLYALAMNSGTSALHIAVKTLGLSAGDEIITTPFSFIASSNCFVYEGVRPSFVDIDPRTLNMDVSQIEQAITSKTKAILVVHLFGQPCDMDPILSVAKKHNLFVIEDACEAIGSKWKGKSVGTLGDVGVFAFYPNKQLTTGEGGMLITNNWRVYELASSLRNQGRGLNSGWLNHEVIGYNYRMSDLQAAVGLAQMERLTEMLKKREDVAGHYLELIGQYGLPISTPFIHPHCTMSWFVFIVILPKGADRKKIMDFLMQKGIQTRPYFPAIHLQQSYINRFAFCKGDFPITEEMAERTLAIPFYNQLSATEQKYVVEQLAFALVREDNNG
ncbi:DegT/DnrJ/EryC1/StrS family aminotransferase [Kroppenstedtia eburnea]|uniref:Perosamine synthetase n=1 Tax=Kroppenstedtia eburnea TaxID=714067 RepID=A0A1N7Q8P1_9BACL|nr:DegT/DnrJ/EryC1/StrS family aminotransferase [Kroppenstedtia eburnea]EGK12909.1 pleiotropic regulatory protein DegT [Desmospora sp. 8437]QKI82593.1 DegT/DnrJ/EryC1/StrS family aminotransferase [Kroppenstedtia eburnea]SIT19213.1 perosamine synthetase [Kroppenstedtia eburnea]